jgi:hypothetical protein
VTNTTPPADAGTVPERYILGDIVVHVDGKDVWIGWSGEVERKDGHHHGGAGRQEDGMIFNDPIANALNDVAHERARQNAKWGTQRLSWPEWIAILTEEVGEAAKEAVDLHWNHDGAHIAALRKELIHVAAVAVQIIEHIDDLETNQ